MTSQPQNPIQARVATRAARRKTKGQGARFGSRRGCVSPHVAVSSLRRIMRGAQQVELFGSDLTRWRDFTRACRKVWKLPWNGLGGAAFHNGHPRAVQPES